MHPKRKVRSALVPAVIGAILIIITVALTVGWYILIVRDSSRWEAVSGRVSEVGFTSLHWMLVILGGLFFALIITGLVLAIIMLAREIRLNQNQQNFIDAVTHELKTPIASIRLYVETMLMRDVAAAKRQDFLNIINRDLARLDTTINHVLEAASASKGADAGKFSALIVNDIVHECIHAVERKYRMPEGKIRLDERVTGCIMGERVAVEMVFMNLIDNAVKYSNGEPVVAVTIRPFAGDGVAVEVSDQGLGIAEHELKRIFNRFYRIAPDQGGGRPGTGLGLYLVKSIMHNHHGKIIASSAGAGKGATFTVEFPAVELSRAHE